ncbi:cytochrome-c peroxidase [Microbulbifer hainanensis]|uniref:cytochrome-c peroxidase n=1 Tax=Microbulbifer hainanensis TaxID=2735675 RepID=UPI00186960C4|nr:cytochrome c peroxidase [Microbulbifer hainanensis]
MKKLLVTLLILVPLAVAAESPPLGLPPLPVPKDNPQTPEKIALGDRLFHDIRFSTTGEVSCSTCHEREKTFTDSPLVVSEGINKLKGTRNAPTVVNSAYNKTQFWDGRSPSLEDQSQHPFVNPVEMGLKSHQPILDIIAKDDAYQRAFKKVFGVSGKDVTIEHVKKAIASFERTVISGNSRFDRWYFGGEKDALSEQEKRGFQVFLTQGRCVSCHTIEENFALFTDQKFHNIGVGINDLTPQKIEQLSQAFQRAKAKGVDVDVAVLTDKDTSDLGRFAITDELSDMGGFKTSTLRNIAETAPYMHDGSIGNLRDVVVHYNNGGALKKDTKITPYLSGGIRPLELTDQQIDDLVAFMETLTSPEFAGKGSANKSAKSKE